MSSAQSISVRLDPQAASALRALERLGMNRSEAIRHALVAAARQREQRRTLTREVAELASDGRDRDEKAAVAAHLDEISEPW